MKFLHLITGKAGKFALSALQAVGLSAAVGVAGIAAWQYLDTPADNTAFNPSQFNNGGEVVYVAGATGGTYGSNGEVQSAFMAKPSKALEMIERQEQQAALADEMQDSADMAAGAQLPSTPSMPTAYQMGGSEGLGGGGNVAREQDLKNNPMALVQQSMGNIQGVIAQAQAQGQAQANAAAQAPADAAANAPKLASASRDWGRGALGNGGGNAFNSSFSVQSSGLGGNGSGTAPSAGEAQTVMSDIQQRMASANTLADTNMIKGRSSFGGDGLGGSRGASSMGARRGSKGANELEFIRKRSADAARNKHRSPNEAGRAFLASTQVSGGLMIDGTNVTTGQGQGSKDFEGETNARLRGVGSHIAEVAIPREDQRSKDRNNLNKWMWTAIGSAIAAMITIPAIKHITVMGVPVGLIMAIALAVAVTAICVVGFVKAAQFANTWGGSGLSTTLMILTPILTAGVWLSFAFAGAMKGAYASVLKTLGISGGVGSSILTTTAGVGAMGAISPWIGGSGE